MKKIGIDEVHKHVLSIAKVFDEICTQHQIPYYMIGGTMLGAVRHNGFIPWDDDMDFGVPIEYYKQLEFFLLNELPYPYRCCTFKNHPAVVHNYIKIEDQTTCVNDPAVDLPIEQKLGVNIDIFPLNRCTYCGKREQRIRKLVKLIGMVYCNSTTHSNSRIRIWIKVFLRFIFGKTSHILQKKVEKHIYSINEGAYLGNLLGRWGEKEIIPIEWYGISTRYAFEDTSFVGVANYDTYLTHVYGNYSNLPPREQQVAHVDNIYLR